jgi:hypothetical protein
MKTPTLAATLLGLSLLGGCAAPGPTTASYPYPPIPAPRPEVIPKPPVTATPLLWEPGHWNWTGAGYVWQQGRYVPRGNHNGMFMPGWWRQDPSGTYHWVPAHWL